MFFVGINNSASRKTAPPIPSSNRVRSRNLVLEATICSNTRMAWIAVMIMAILRMLKAQQYPSECEENEFRVCVHLLDSPCFKLKCFTNPASLAWPKTVRNVIEYSPVVQSLAAYRSRPAATMCTGAEGRRLSR